MTHVCKRLILGLLKGFLSFYAINFLTKSAPKKRGVINKWLAIKCNF